MKKLTFSLEQFDLKKFLEETSKHGKNILNVPVFAVENIEEFDFDVCVEEYENSSIDVFYQELLNGKYLFASFCDCGVNYPDVACIDGNVYQTIEEVEEEDYFDDGAPADFVFTNKIKLGEESNIGYLLKYENGQLTIHKAQFYMDAAGGIGPCSTRHLTAFSAIVIIEDVEVFEKPMQNYLHNFIK
ncbi:hypothetical protein C0971_09465 [Bacillus methanolicus]|uniref:hypothetical protein n=1 Tax=Bacillus methanolicus TaxID=1471 RepID=UPI00200BCEF4|nr:hypothetical protein [Bacillus methanolicus]UQD52222.1 hypothetical protein C0971_09465 [Bacillus methanolicus]